MTNFDPKVAVWRSQNRSNLLVALPVAVGMPVTRHPAHSSVHEDLLHTALTVGHDGKPLFRTRVYIRAGPAGPTGTVINSSINNPLSLLSVALMALQLLLILAEGLSLHY
ncbi:MAG: hypothetical protein ABSA46_17545 [Thermodesulfovibrionales bacterium]|jgi:hypothetical protein